MSNTLAFDEHSALNGVALLDADSHGPNFLGMCISRSTYISNGMKNMSVIGLRRDGLLVGVGDEVSQHSATEYEHVLIKRLIDNAWNVPACGYNFTTLFNKQNLKEHSCNAALELTGDDALSIFFDYVNNNNEKLGSCQNIYFLEYRRVRRQTSAFIQHLNPAIYA